MHMFHDWVVHTGSAPAAPALLPLFQPTSEALLGVPCDQVTQERTFESALEMFPHRNLA